LLSQSESASIEIENMGDEDYNGMITKTIFEQICMDLFVRCLNPISEALKDAGLEKGQINELILVGGSSRIPKIQ